MSFMLIHWQFNIKLLEINGILFFVVVAISGGLVKDTEKFFPLLDGKMSLI